MGKQDNEMDTKEEVPHVSCAVQVQLYNGSQFVVS